MNSDGVACPALARRQTRKMVPRVIGRGLKDYTVVNGKQMATCKTCGTNITDGEETTFQLCSTLRAAQRPVN